MADESASFECSLDGGGFGPCVSPVSYSSLVAGPHHFEVRATDLAGNVDPTPATWDWVISATLTFAPVADSYVDERNPVSNFGSLVSLKSDGGSGVLEESLLRFDVAGVTGPVTSAVLRIYATNGTGNGPEVFPAENGWSELGVNWTNRPLRTGGAVFDAGAIPAGGWYEFDVTSLVAGDGTITLNLASVSTDAVKFRTREFAGFEPQLVVSTG